MQRATFTLIPTPPYDFALTALHATYGRGRYGADSFEDGVFRRLLDLGGDTLALATVRSTDTMNKPKLAVELQGPSLGKTAVAVAKRQVAWLLDTAHDITHFYRMAKRDPVLRKLVANLHGLHLAHTLSVYEALVLAILGQQISGHVARMLRTLLIQTYGPSLEVGGVTYFAFPRPESLVAAGIDGLRKIKFSGRKSEYIADIATRVASGDLDLEALRTLPDDEAVDALVRIRGVGLWTANWVFIRALGRPDGLPHGDLALQRTLGMLVNGGKAMSADEALAYSERWKPFRSYVTAYLFAAIRTGGVERLTAEGAEDAGKKGRP